MGWQHEINTSLKSRGKLDLTNAVWLALNSRVVVLHF